MALSFAASERCSNALRRSLTLTSVPNHPETPHFSQPTSCSSYLRHEQAYTCKKAQTLCSFKLYIVQRTPNLYDQVECIGFLSGSGLTNLSCITPPSSLSSISPSLPLFLTHSHLLSLSLTHSLTHLLTNSLTQLLTHSLSYYSITSDNHKHPNVVDNK